MRFSATLGDIAMIIMFTVFGFTTNAWLFLPAAMIFCCLFADREGRLLFGMEYKSGKGWRRMKP